jgi:hypothetical protein
MKFDLGDPHMFFINHLSIVIRSTETSTQLWVIWSFGMQPFLEEHFHVAFGHIYILLVFLLKDPLIWQNSYKATITCLQLTTAWVKKHGLEFALWLMHMHNGAISMQIIFIIID